MASRRSEPLYEGVQRPGGCYSGLLQRDSDLGWILNSLKHEPGEEPQRMRFENSESWS